MDRLNSAKRKFLLISITLCCVFVVSAQNEQEITDADITSAIESDLFADPQVPVNDIDVSTKDGVVKLGGKVNNILVKDRTADIAQSIVGVRSVVNTIEVSPPDMITDTKIKKDVERALQFDPATNAKSIDVQAEVSGGVVTLSGTVASWQQKQLCSNVAKGVIGVTEVANNIAIDYEADRSDKQIRNEVQAVLSNDVRVDDALVYVEVNDGEVSLKGTVGSLSEKNLARSLAWVSGVKNVSDENLEIKWWARDSMRRKQLYTTRTDDDIRSAVKDALRYDPRIEHENIDVNVRFGRVTLSGVVDNLKARKAAQWDARNTMGVSSVKNNIRVRFAEEMSDDDLADKVRSELDRDNYLERFDINVIAVDGRVYLSGEVNTSWEKDHAERLIEKIYGVNRIVNNITYQDDWTWKPDWEIKDDVEGQLMWSPFVDGGDINVSVDDGVVTLTGEVDTYSESQSAVDNAYQGGAKKVNNELKIDYDYYGPYHYGPYSPTYFYPYYSYYY
jgi:osmotically-inducible protein OsmY